MLESMLSDRKKAKSLLSTWEEVLVDNTYTSSLFGDKFEEKLCKHAKLKRKTRDALKNLNPKSNHGARKIPFRRGSLAGPGPTRGQSNPNPGFNQKFRFNGFNSNNKGKRSFYSAARNANSGGVFSG